MTTVLILGLAAIALYLAKSWHGSKSENAQLRTQIISLKRQLTKYRHIG